MKVKIVPLVLVFLLLLTACGTDTPQMTEAPTESLQNDQTEENAEQPTTPTQSDLEPVVLEILAEERCAITGNCRIAETENGYYMLRGEYLFYADKSDLTNWVLVCSQPECSHSPDVCTAHIGIFWLNESEIYYIVLDTGSQDFDGDHFAAMGLDSTSPRLVFTDSALNSNSMSYGSSDTGTHDSFVRCLASMKENGDWDCAVIQINSTGVKTLFSTDYPSAPSGDYPTSSPYNVGFSVRGDVIINSRFPLDGTPDENKEDWASRGFDLYYQVTNDTIREIKLHENCDLYGAYISGDSLWHYHMNDGFYYMDLSTGEEVKIADAAYKNAYGHCVDGKHMVECSLSVPGYTRDAAEPHMRYFDGEVWHELELPEHWNAQYKFRVWAGASDRIVFTVDDDAERSSDRQQELGYIILGEDSLTICDKYPSRVSFD